MKLFHRDCPIRRSDRYTVTTVIEYAFNKPLAYNRTKLIRVMGMYMIEFWFVHVNPVKMDHTKCSVKQNPSEQ